MRDIVGYEGLYKVSENGLIFNEARGIVMKQHNKDGYMRVTLTKDGRKKNFAIHRLVAEAYIDNPNELKQVDHIDEDKKNNDANNLRWCTHQENSDFYDHTKKRISNVPVKIKINENVFESINKASKFIADEEGKNKDSINREMRRFIASGRESWTAYKKYTITNAQYKT